VEGTRREGRAVLLMMSHGVELRRPVRRACDDLLMDGVKVLLLLCVMGVMRVLWVVVHPGVMRSVRVRLTIDLLELLVTMRMSLWCALLLVQLHAHELIHHRIVRTSRLELELSVRWRGMRGTEGELGRRRVEGRGGMERWTLLKLSCECCMCTIRLQLLRMREGDRGRTSEDREAEDGLRGGRGRGAAFALEWRDVLQLGWHGGELAGEGLQWIDGSTIHRRDDIATHRHGEERPRQGLREEEEINKEDDKEQRVRRTKRWVSN
jgi:hypothetical protein